jgi:hypothetical protein
VATEWRRSTTRRPIYAALERMPDARTGERDEALAREAALAEVLDAINHSSGDPQQHGGTITVHSRVGEFTEFPIHLPRSQQAATAGRGGVTASARLLRRGACPRAAQSADPGAPSNDMICFVIASGAKQSRSRAALRCSDIFEPMQKSLFNSPSPPPGAERVGVRWGRADQWLRRRPPHPPRR